MRGWLKWLLWCVAGFAALLILAYSALHFVVLPRLDAMLASAVRREFALPEASSVEIARGNLADTLGGHLPRFTITSGTAVLDNMPVEDLHFSAQAISFNVKEIIAGEKARLTELGPCELSLKTSQQALMDRWSGPLAEKGYTKAEVELTPDGAKISVLKKFKLIGRMRIGAKGVFEVDGTSRVRFRAIEMEVGEAVFGVRQFNAVMTDLVPAIDLETFSIHVRVDELYTTLGYLHVSASSGGNYNETAETGENVEAEGQAGQ